MIAGTWLSPLVTKEIRALWPIWVPSMLLICVDALAGDWWLAPSWRLTIASSAGVAGYVLGSVAVGAQAMGHEYTHRTLGTLLAQPRDRRRLFAMKLTVLAVMLGALAVLAYAVLFYNPHSRLAAITSNPALLPIPLLLGLFVAPWMTMLGRSALAGVVFTIALPGTILIVCEATGALMYGAASSQVDAIKLAVWPKAMLALSVLGAVFACRRFMRLEAIEGTGADIHLTRGRAAGRPRAGSPIWRLVKKEFHLQQLTLALVGLYLIGWASISALKYFMPEFRDFPLIPVTMLYLVLLSMLMGSLASAEERQLGTLEWQVLLPIAAWQQWLVKAATVLALALAFGIGLPAVLTYLDPSGRELRDATDAWQQIVVMIVVLTTCSLYVSSFSMGGLRALMLSVVAVAVLAATPPLAERLASWIFSTGVVESAGRAVALQLRRSMGFLPAVKLTTALLVSGLVVLLVRFGLDNHRSAERNPAAVLPQALCVFGYLVVTITISIGVLTLYYGA